MVNGNAANVDAGQRVVVVGATRNFFKVGHTTLRELARTRPDVALRLGIPNISHGRKAVADLPIELMEWDPSTPATLEPVLQGCSGMLMVPPIDHRVDRAADYLRAARRAGVDYILCLGVQHVGKDLHMARQADRVTELLQSSGIPFDILHLPMFLENLLYQLPGINERSVFTYPVSGDAQFAYLTCQDLGEVAARQLTDPTPLDDTTWTSPRTITCRQWSDALSEATGRSIRFVTQSPDDFLAHLQNLGMDEPYAQSVLELWQQIDAGQDIPASSTFAEILGRSPQQLQAWTTEHGCCFKGSRRCNHPRPPRSHMY